MKRNRLYAIVVMSKMLRPRFNVLQESLIKLVEACNDHSNSVDRWLSKLEASNWLSHVKEILTTACLAAQCIDRSAFLTAVFNSLLLCLIFACTVLDRCALKPSESLQKSVVCNQLTAVLITVFSLAVPFGAN